MCNVCFLLDNTFSLPKPVELKNALKEADVSPSHYLEVATRIEKKLEEFQDGGVDYVEELTTELEKELNS